MTHKMEQLVDGQWREHAAYSNEAGRFERWESPFRQWISADGGGEFAPEPGRYRLYVSLACPWAHRTLIIRALKKLDAVIAVSVVDPLMGARSWHFSDAPGCTPDTENGFRHLYEAYLTADPRFTGMVTVPVLWDQRTRTIVNNESSEIIRMLNSAFDAFGDARVDFYPEALRADIDAVNAQVYEHVNNGVYRAGFATRQDAYEAAFDALFDTLDALERRLAGQRYLLGARLTEADWRLFTTLVRFDAVYAGHFKCNRRRLVDYPHLWAYTRELYQVPGVAATVNMDHIKRHYYQSHRQINPTGIVPRGPDIDFTAAHGRERLPAEPWRGQ